MSRSALFGEEARKSLITGAHLVRDAVKETMGPKGKTVVIQVKDKNPIITKDGISVAKEIQPKDEKVAIGAQLVRSVAQKAMDTSGDGTTTATVLAGAIIDEGIRYSAANANLNDIRRGIEYGAKKVVEKLGTIATKIDNLSRLIDVATISANGDTKLGRIVAEAYDKVGLDGVVTVEESKDRDITMTMTEGMRLDRGWVSPYFKTNVQDGTAEFNDPAILLVDGQINNAAQLIRIIEPVVSAGRPVVIIAEGFETTVINSLVYNIPRGLKICCVEAPGYGERKTEILRDLGCYLGAKVADDVMGVRLDEVTSEDMGSCERIIIKKDETIIRGGKGDQETVKARIEEIKREMQATDIVYEKQKLRERLGSLTTGVATIRVGGSSEEEIKELKDRLDDAMWSVKSALEEGFVPGSGRTLAYLSTHFDYDEEYEALNDDQKLGVKILQKAMMAPFKTILSNADQSPDVFMAELADAPIDEGYNVATMEKVNLVEAGIIDAAKVTRCALQAASSIASLILTTNVVITQDPEEKGLQANFNMMPGLM